MPTLHLGVLDPMLEPNGKTAYEVGMELEAKYGLYTRFYEANKNFIADKLADSVQHAIDQILRGDETPSNPFMGGAAEVEERFKDFLTNSEIESLGVPNVPTYSALQGLTKRKRAGGKARKVKGTWETKEGARRPSFVDSGTQRASLKAWVD